MHLSAVFSIMDTSSIVWSNQEIFKETSSYIKDCLNVINFEVHNMLEHERTDVCVICDIKIMNISYLLTYFWYIATTKLMISQCQC